MSEHDGHADASDQRPEDHRGQQYQPEQSGMYELEFPAPQLSAADGRGPVMVHALEGFSDAGHAIRLAAEHLTLADGLPWDAVTARRGAVERLVPILMTALATALALWAIQRRAASRR